MIKKTFPKQARGDLVSFPVEEIVSRVEQAFREGVIELWITSEDTGAYGRDIGTDLPTLMRAITEVIPEGCMMRLGMTNPPYIVEHIDAMVEVLNHPRVYSFMHIPVQSGSDAVLYSMKREYSRDDFIYLVDKLRAGVPRVHVATDIIAGYPAETEQDWEDTMSLCKSYKFESLFVNQFFPRPGTVAARMEQIDRRLIKRRTKELSEFFKSYENETYSDQLGEEQEVLVTEKAFDKVSFVGHNKWYTQVLLDGESELGNLIGKRLKVKIYEVSKHYVKGKILEDVTPESWSTNQVVGNGHQLPESGCTLDHVGPRDPLQKTECPPSNCCGGSCSVSDTTSKRKNNSIWVSIGITVAVLAVLGMVKSRLK